MGLSGDSHSCSHFKSPGVKQIWKNRQHGKYLSDGLNKKLDESVGILKQYVGGDGLTIKRAAFCRPESCYRQCPPITARDARPWKEMPAALLFGSRNPSNIDIPHCSGSFLCPSLDVWIRWAENVFLPLPLEWLLNALYETGLQERKVLERCITWAWIAQCFFSMWHHLLPLLCHLFQTHQRCVNHFKHCIYFLMGPVTFLVGFFFFF